MISGKWRMRISEDDRVRIHGLDMGGTGKVVAKNAEYVAVKWPSGTYWVGVLCDRAYHSPETIIYKILEAKEDGSLRVEGVLNWEHTRKRKEKKNR